LKQNPKRYDKNNTVTARGVHRFVGARTAGHNSFEALIHDNPGYQELFTKEELKNVRKRLVDYQYKPAKAL